MTPPRVEDRFWAKVDKTDACWLWVGHTTHNGYGHFRVTPTQTVRAHRLAWEITNGPIPMGLLVCHHCDTPRCVNPDHLFLGTQKDNIADRDRKGRGINGVRNGKNKLTPVEVEAIRVFVPARYGDLARLALQHGVSRATVHGIRTNKIWKVAHAA